jgi:hypothetical protein
VLLTLNLNDTILQKENAFIFQQITCGKAALCYGRCSTGIPACVGLSATFIQFSLVVPERCVDAR